jgi:hypothetical protein
MTKGGDRTEPLCTLPRTSGGRRTSGGPQLHQIRHRRVAQGSPRRSESADAQSKQAVLFSVNHATRGVRRRKK